jgi:hypothetical protein
MTMTPMLDELRTLGECGARGASVAGMRMLAGTTLGLSGDGDEPRAVSARTETTTTTGMRFTKDLLGKSSSAHHSSATAIPMRPVAAASLHRITRTRADRRFMRQTPAVCAAVTMHVATCIQDVVLC